MVGISGSLTRNQRIRPVRYFMSSTSKVGLSAKRTSNPMVNVMTMKSVSVALKPTCPLTERENKFGTIGNSMPHASMGFR